MRERPLPPRPGGRELSSGHGHYTGAGEGNSWVGADTQEWESGVGFYEIDITMDRITIGHPETQSGEGFGYGKLSTQDFMQEVQARRGYY